MRLERRALLEPDEFVEVYVRPARPVLITDAIKGWREKAEPLSETFLLRTFADSEVQIYNDLFDLVNICRLGEYVEQYWNAPFAANVPYIRWYARFHAQDFEWADDAFARIAPHWSMPYFLPHTNYVLPSCQEPATLDVVSDAFPAKGIFLSASGARTRLHLDPWCSDAVLCQLSGRKQLVLYAPDALEFLSDESGLVDLDAPDISRFPRFDLRPPDITDVLEPGETLYIPSGWLHHVVTLTSSISLTWNFVHSVHAPRFNRYRAGPLSAFDRGVLAYFESL
jgi:hypothetical protein